MGTSSDGFIKEFTPQHSRRCNTIAWNPVHHTMVGSPLSAIVPRHSPRPLT
jgi:hypothetical protein